MQGPSIIPIKNQGTATRRVKNPRVFEVMVAIPYVFVGMMEVSAGRRPVVVYSCRLPIRARGRKMLEDLQSERHAKTTEGVKTSFPRLLEH